MKSFLISLFLSLSLGLCAQTQSIVKFETTSIDLGIIDRGQKATGVFTFTNISDEEVEIDIVSTCECTEAQWPSYPLSPGEIGEIKFTFDSSKKDEEEPVEIDVYFVNTDPKTGNPISVFLSYSFKYKSEKRP